MAALRTGRSSSSATEISVAGIFTEEEAMQLLDATPMSCVKVDLRRHVAQFGFAPEDLYDPSELLRAGWNSSNARCKGSLKVSAEKPSLAILVPTYPQHQVYYERLVASVRRNVQLGNSSDTIVLVSVFSSMAEGAEMTQNCSACSSSTEGRSSPPSSSVAMRPLIFNKGYQDHTKWRRKLNYQTAKKIWALQHGSYDKVLIVDSDFAILRPIVLRAALEPYERVLYEVKVTALAYDQGKLFRWMMESVRRVLNNSEALTSVPFEMPWIYQKLHVNALVDYLAEQSGGDYTDYILNLKRKRLFEPVLYRAFVLSRFPTFFQQRIPTTKFWFEDSSATESERLALQPPPIGVRHWLQERSPCKVCWLEAHADRDYSDEPHETDSN